MEKLDKKYVIKKLTLFFLFLLPLAGIEFFHNRLTTLLIVIIICFLFLLTVLVNKDSRKNIKYIIIYYIICFLYLLITYFRSESFVSLIPDRFSIISEGLTILKLMMPGTFLYVLYYQRIERKEYFRIIKWWIILIAGLIIITNIFKISFSSYSDELIKYNIFEWSKNIYYIDTASRGFFTYANQITVILLMLLLVSIYLTIYESKKNIVYSFITSLAMIMLGTRISSLGGLLTLIFTILFYFFYVLYKKEKLNKVVFALIGLCFIWGLILPISPFNNRRYELNRDVSEDIIINNDEIEQNNESDIETLSEKKEYVLNNYDSNYLPYIFFLEYYPIEYDEDFWYEFVKNNKMSDLDYRYIEKSIVKRMWEIDNKWSNTLFGITNTRIQQVVNVESDFVLHYYAFGIVGSIILLLVYLLLVIYSIYMFFKKQTIYLFIYTTIIIIYLFCAYLSGNIINSLFPTISFTFIISGIFLGEKVDND